MSCTMVILLHCCFTCALWRIEKEQHRFSLFQVATTDLDKSYKILVIDEKLKLATLWLMSSSIHFREWRSLFSLLKSCLELPQLIEANSETMWFLNGDRNFPELFDFNCSLFHIFVSGTFIRFRNIFGKVKRFKAM